MMNPNIPDNHFVPRRTAIILTRLPEDGERLYDVFVGYRCLDCNYFTTDPQKITDHQYLWLPVALKNLWQECIEWLFPENENFKAQHYPNTWHGWAKAWERLRDS